jgi:prenyltransferase beta subunit
MSTTRILVLFPALELLAAFVLPHFVQGGVGGVATAGEEPAAGQATAFKELPFVEMRPEAQQALKAVQDFIAKHQRADGAFAREKDPGEDALCSLALMVGGSNAGVGPYGKEIAQNVNYLLLLQDNTGFFPSQNAQHGMYGHALATLLLTEVWGASRQPEMKDKLRKAVQLIVDCQNKNGGWSYHPKIEDRTDLSVTVMQTMALRSAVDAGIFVPQATIEKAVKAIKGCFNEKDGGFGYTGPDQAKFSTTGAGLTALQTVGVYRDRMIEQALRYVQTNSFGSKKEWFWYGHYYISVAMYHEGGQAWEEYYPKVLKIALEAVNSKKHRELPLWENCFVALVLGMPYRYIPIYQR